MLIPQFSLRWMLGATTVCAVLFSIIGLAVQGSKWAAAVSLGLLSLVVFMGVGVSLFGVVWVFSLVGAWLGRRRVTTGASPFASGFSEGGAPAVVSTPGGSPFRRESPFRQDSARAAGLASEQGESPAEPLILDEAARGRGEP